MHQSGSDNLKALLTEHIDKQIIDLLEQTGRLATSLEMKAYAVGGFVRDLLLGQRNYDIDLVIEGDGVVFAKDFKKKFGKAIKTFPRFGTSFVILKSGKRVDISTARTEHYPSPGSLPEVTFSGIRNDLYRRDFTINSLAIGINPEEFGKLYDFYGGRSDLQSGVIRVLNDFSFMDDPIRILRAIRFEQRFGFTLEDKTNRLLQESLQMLTFNNVSAERIHAELVYSCKKGPVAEFFQRLSDLQILSQINPNLTYTAESKEICRNLAGLIVRFRNSFPEENVQYWSTYHLALINNLTLPQKEEFAVTLKYSALFLESVRKTDSFINGLLPALSQTRDEGEIALELSRLNIESLLFLIARTNDQDIKDKISRYLTTTRFIQPELKGDDIIKLGLPEGREIGKIIGELRRMKINGSLPDKQAELVFVEELISGLNKPS